MLVFFNKLGILVKVWDIRTKKLKQDLPGHADEVNSLAGNSKAKKSLILVC